MKKIIFGIFATLAMSVLSYGQLSETPFVFVKSTILKIEKQSTIQNNYEFGTPELKKRMQGMFLIDSLNSSINYDINKYIKFSTIPETEKFIFVTNSEYGNHDYNKNLIIQNVKTKQLYAIMAFAIKKYQDYSNMSNEANGNGWLIKWVPKELSQSEKELLNRYKGLIKSANQNISVLLSIQKKNLIRKHFDPSKVNSIDRKTYNKNLDELKSKAQKLLDIDRYEDTDDKIQNKLSLDELGSLDNINNWNLNQIKI